MCRLPERAATVSVVTAMPDNQRKPWLNAEGYHDPTAFAALQPMMREEAALDSKCSFLIKVLKFIINESGFELVNRIELRDRKTGRYFK